MMTYARTLDRAGQATTIVACTHDDGSMTFFDAANPSREASAYADWLSAGNQPADRLRLNRTSLVRSRPCRCVARCGRPVCSM